MATDAGGIKLSGMEFLSYRLVRLNLESGPQIAVTPNGIPEESQWQLSIGLGDVEHYQDGDIYVSSVSAKMTLLPRIFDDKQKISDEPILSAEGTIYGVFRILADAEIDTALKQKLLLNQTPAVLMPFLRAAISGLLALAGYGALPMPLINMLHLAEKKPREIIEIENKA